MPDEMYRDPGNAAPGPVDVYELAKTLWVLAAGQGYPPQGELRPEYLPNLLRTLFDEETRAYKLDLLLEKATKQNPAERPTMEAFERELRAWLSPTKPEALMVNEERDAEFRERLAALNAPGRAREEAVARLTEAFEKSTASLRERIHPLRQRMERVSQIPMRVMANFAFNNAGIKGEQMLWEQHSFGTTAQGKDFNFVGGIALRLLAGGTVHLTAAYAFMTTNAETLAAWYEMREAPIGSAQEDQATSELLAWLADNFDEKFALFLEKLR